MSIRPSGEWEIMFERLYEWQDMLFKILLSSSTFMKFMNQELKPFIARLWQFTFMIFSTTAKTKLTVDARNCICHVEFQNYGEN